MIDFPDDKIRIILKEMDIENKPIKFDEKIFQITLYEYKKKYPELLNEFFFSKSGTYPYSDLLERILHRAKISRNLKTVNPDFEYVELKDGVCKYTEEEIIPKFKETDYQALKEIGMELNKKFCQTQS